MLELKVREPKRRTPVSELEFIGCDPIRVSAVEIERPEWEGRRVEYWHAATETAWIAREPVSPYHEFSSSRLVALVERICLARGAPAVCFGSMDLRVRADDATLGDFMQADQTVYLHPDRAKLPHGGQLVVGEDDPPDVLLEVDNTTDVRRGKLVAYGEWGFPEVWVEAPERGTPGRAKGVRPGLRIHRLEDGEYREVPESRAFPGWRAAEIHEALNEPALTYETQEVLWRVGRALGRRERTVPEDDHLLRRMDRRGHARGLAEGRARRALEERAALVAAILRRRGVEVPPDFPTGLSPEDHVVLADAAPDDIVAAASRAASLADFVARLR